MTPDLPTPSSKAVTLLFGLLNPIPFGFFVGALMFDVAYASSADVLWFKSAAWLISIGLIFAVVPRLINLVRVWFAGARPDGREQAAFFVYLLAVVAAIVNAFVHSRDAFAIVPEGLWLSVLTVALLAVGNVLETLRYSDKRARELT